MIKKIAEEKYNDTFWKEFGTNVKLGVIEDHSNRTRLAKLLRFQSSHHESNLTSLDQYVERMKEKQDKIYFMAGASRKEVCKSERKRKGVQHITACSFSTINPMNCALTVNVEIPMFVTTTVWFFWYQYLLDSCTGFDSFCYQFN